jgi:hypothetical protein
MGRTLGVWEIEHEQALDHVVVTQENYEVLQIYMEENDWQPSQIYLLKSNVVQNESVFAWCIQRAILKDNTVEIHAGTHDTNAGRLMNLLEHFLSAFKQLDVERCNYIVSVCSSIDFSKFYLYKTRWLLEQLTNFVTAIRFALIDRAPVSFSAVNCRTWWDQPLELKSTIESFRNSIDLESLKEIDSLYHLVDAFEKISKAAGEWGGYHNKAERHEPASGCLFALSKYWFLNNQLSLTILSAHRGIDLMLQFLALKDGLLVPTVRGLVYDDANRERVSYFETFKLLDRDGKFTPTEAKLIRQLNDVRNHSREIHGFYVANEIEVKHIMDGIDQLLLRLLSETKIRAIREKFDFAIQLELSVFFDVEAAFDSYFDVI